MVKHITKIVLIVLSLILIFACEAGKQVELDVEVNVTLDGKPASKATVILDSVELGATDRMEIFQRESGDNPAQRSSWLFRKKPLGMISSHGRIHSW